MSAFFRTTFYTIYFINLLPCVLYTYIITTSPNHDTYFSSGMTSTLQSARDKSIASNSLICLLQSLVGQVTTVELRNENSVVGEIAAVDTSMNVSMLNVVYHTETKTDRLDCFYIRGRNIRYVFIPDHISIAGTLRTQLGPKGPRRRQHLKRENRYKIISEALSKQGTSNT